MINIWCLKSAFSTDMRFTIVNEAGAPPISVTHSVYLNSPVSRSAGIFGGHMGERPPVAAELTLELEDFDLDFFNWGGTMFVSEHMRNVMALGPSEVRFLDIDDSQVAPLPRSKNYKIMEPLLVEDVLDVEKCVYDPEPITEENPWGPTRIYSLAVRPDAAPDIDLFYDGFFATVLLCTEQFAKRILDAGCTGMEFSAPTAYRRGNPILYRTQRGIERYVSYDKVNDIDIIDFIQAII